MQLLLLFEQFSVGKYSLPEAVANDNVNFDIPGKVAEIQGKLQKKSTYVKSMYILVQSTKNIDDTISGFIGK